MPEGYLNVYIIHFALLEICQESIVTRFPGSPLLAHMGGVLAAALATWAVAQTSWRYLESPMIRRGRSHVYWPRGNHLSDDCLPSSSIRAS